MRLTIHGITKMLAGTAYSFANERHSQFCNAAIVGLLGHLKAIGGT